MPNTYNNKIVLADGTILIDLTGDTADVSHVLSGSTFHDASGAPQVGTCTYDSDTSDDTALAGEILSGKTAHARGAEITGTMANRGAVTGTISTKAQEYIIQNGFHDGSGKVAIASAEQDKIIPGNIKSGINILGILGTYSGESITAQTKSATPKLTAQSIQPDAGYDYLSEVDIAAITITYADNSAGGKTVTIGAV